MSGFIRFDVYIPQKVLVRSTDESTGVTTETRYAVSGRTLRDFVRSTAEAVGTAVTISVHKRPAVSRLSQVFFRGRPDSAQVEARKFLHTYGFFLPDEHLGFSEHFNEWKARLEESFSYGTALFLYHEVDAFDGS